MIDAIRNDPEWKGGEYTTQPPGLRTAAQMLWLVGSNPIIRQRQAPTLAQADEVIRRLRRELRAHRRRERHALRARVLARLRSRARLWRRSRAPLLAINSADDLVNPPELGILEREITRVPHGRAVIVPLSDRTAGHGTHTVAAVWAVLPGRAAPHD